MEPNHRTITQRSRTIKVNNGWVVSAGWVVLSGAGWAVLGGVGWYQLGWWCWVSGAGWWCWVIAHLQKNSFYLDEAFFDIKHMSSLGRAALNTALKTALNNALNTALSTAQLAGKWISVTSIAEYVPAAKSCPFRHQRHQPS